MNYTYLAQIIIPNIIILIYGTLSKNNIAAILLLFILNYYFQISSYFIIAKLKRYTFSKKFIISQAVYGIMILYMVFGILATVASDYTYYPNLDSLQKIFNFLDISHPLFYLITIFLSGMVPAINLFFNPSANNFSKQKININFYIMLFIIVFGGIFILPMQVDADPNEVPGAIWNGAGIIVFILIKTFIESYVVFKRPIPMTI